jgi:hypothetical protein
MDKRELTGMVYAFTMGDGCIYYPHKTSQHTIFTAENIIDNEDYIYWRADILQNITKVHVYHRDNSERSKRSGWNCKDTLRTVTRTHPIYTKVYNRLYGTGRKAIDPHQLTFMSWQMLAILYMDDGSVVVDKRCKNATPAVTLHTKSFSHAENVMLKRAIEEKLGIYFNVVRQSKGDKIYWFLRLRSKDYITFRNGVEPYIFPSFQYKIPEFSKIPNG